MKKSVCTRSQWQKWFAPLSVSVLGIAVMTMVATASRAEDGPSNEELLQRLKSLEAEVKELRAERAATVQAKPAAVKSAPTITVGADGFNARSADTNFVFSIHGIAQFDTRNFIDDNPKSVGNDQFLMRRLRIPIIQGTLFRDLDYRFVPEFGGSTVLMLDAYANYRIWPGLQLRAGKFKAPVGLENLQGVGNLAFSERSLANNLIPNRDIGVQLWGNLWGGTASYAVGVFNGAPDFTGTPANTDTDDSKSVDGRLFFLPFKQTAISPLKGFGIGISGTIQNDHGSTNSGASILTSGYSTDGKQKFFSYNPSTGIVYSKGTHWRLSPQGYYYYGPFSLMGEYVISDQQVAKSTGESARLRNTAWEVTAGWVLTGESDSYNGLVPKHPFDPRNGGWGAWQVVARIAQLDIDDATFPTFANPSTSASRADSWAVGLNWYLNRNLRVNASFSRTTFSGGNGTKAVVTAQPEQLFLTRMQVAF